MSLCCTHGTQFYYRKSRLNHILAYIIPYGACQCGAHIWDYTLPLWTHSTGRQHTSLHVFSASRKNTLGFEMDSKFILRKMIKNIIFKYWKSTYSFWDSVTYKYQPGTVYYRLLPIQIPTLFCIFLFNQSSPSFHKVPHNPGSFPETVHQSLGKTWVINQWWLLNLAKSSTQILLTGSPISYMKTDSKDLINHSLLSKLVES